MRNTHSFTHTHTIFTYTNENKHALYTRAHTCTHMRTHAHILRILLDGSSEGASLGDIFYRAVSLLRPRSCILSLPCNQFTHASSYFLLKLFFNAFPMHGHA